ncbi:MAG: CAP domain-containing protein [Eubacteriales bacterium]|nr:CAP domain-containing protein [Eubacteriales bacterium]
MKREIFCSMGLCAAAVLGGVQMKACAAEVKVVQVMNGEYKVLEEGTLGAECLEQVLEGLGISLEELKGYCPELFETEAETEAPGVAETDVPETSETDTAESETPGSEAPAPTEPETDTAENETPGSETPAPTEPETDAAENETPETPGTPDTESPETDAPDTAETEAPGSEAPAPTEPETDAAESETPDTEAPAPTEPETDAAETDTPSTESPAPALTYAEQVVNLVNEERAKAGLSALTIQPALTAAANVRAQEIKQTFSHTRPNGTSFSTVLKEQGVSYMGSGENIAYGQKTPAQVMEGWMNSDGHRANILNASFKNIGVGYYQDERGVNYWVQLFTY